MPAAVRKPSENAHGDVAVHNAIGDADTDSSASEWTTLDCCSTWRQMDDDDDDEPDGGWYGDGDCANARETSPNVPKRLD